MANLNHVSQTLLLDRPGVPGDVLTVAASGVDAEFAPSAAIAGISVENAGVPVAGSFQTVNALGGTFAAGAPGVVDYTPPPVPPTPTLLAGQGLWVEADVGIGVADGAPIPTWADQSGNGYDVTAAGAVRPVFRAQDVSDGLPFVECDGVQQALLNTAIVPIGVGTLTHYMVFRAFSAGASQGVFSLGNAAGADHTVPDALGHTYSGTWRIGRDGNLYEYPYMAPTNGVRVGPVWHVAAFRYYLVHGQAWLALWVDGAEAYYNLGLGALVNLAFTVCSIGARYYGSALASFTQCDVRAYGWYPVQHTDAEVRQMLRYLGNKWGTPGI